MLVKRIVGDKMPIAVTKNIGHGTDSKAIIIGEEMHLEESAVLSYHRLFDK